LTLGQKIKRFRLLNDIRQEDMADTMGVSRATLINYEKGHTSINVDVLERLKNAYPNFELDDEKIQKPQIIKDNIIDFKVLYNVLHRSRRYIFLFTFFIMFLGLGGSFLFTKFYSAEISLYPAKKDMMQGFTQFQSLAVNLGMNSPKNDQNFNIPDVVKSRLIANKAINQRWLTKNGKKIKLIDLWKINKSSLFSIFNSNTIDSLYIKEKAVKKFTSRISVIEDRLSGLIRITTTLEDPIIASDVANFIGKQVQLYIQKENSAQSTKEKLFISERVAIVKKELEFSELSLKDFKERNRGYEDSPELFMIFSQLFREVEAKKEVYLTLQQQLELARIEEVKQTPILHILDHADVPSRKSSPNRLIFLIGSLVLGFMGSSIITIFRY
tara:strand:- start:202 stop:1356 length:1155 start_codon:yes stop_codon:yes gene_type:complete